MSAGRRAPRPDHWADMCREMSEAWAYLAEAGPGLIKLANMPSTGPDGWASGGGSEPVSGGGGSSSTESAALALLEGVPADSDWVADRLDDVWRHAQAARRSATAARLAAHLVEHRGDGRAGRQVTGAPCQGCERYVPGSSTDRLRRGLCRSCYTTWTDWAATVPDPSVPAFRRVLASRDHQPVDFG